MKNRNLRNLLSNLPVQKLILSLVIFIFFIIYSQESNPVSTNVNQTYFITVNNKYPWLLVIVFGIISIIQVLNLIFNKGSLVGLFGILIAFFGGIILMYNIELISYLYSVSFFDKKLAFDNFNNIFLVFIAIESTLLIIGVLISVLDSVFNKKVKYRTK